MDTFHALRGARKIVETCARVAPDENVLIVTDTALGKHADVLAGAVAQAGAEAVVSIMEPRDYDGNEPPPIVGVAMAAADVAFLLVDRSIAHSRAVRESLHAGTRILSLTGFTRDMFARGGIRANFEELRPMCELVAASLGRASTAHVTTRAGTDLMLDLKGRSGNAHACIVDAPGTIAGVPNIEANIAPVEGTANGTIIIDGSIPNLRRGVLHEEVVLKIDSGYVTEISGGREATLIRELAAKQGSSHAFNVAQLAVGLNPECTAFTGEFQNDHGAYGTIHIGIGSSMNLGGNVDIPFHFDGMLHSPSLSLDGELILDEGELPESLLQNL